MSDNVMVYWTSAVGVPWFMSSARGADDELLFPLGTSTILYLQPQKMTAGVKMMMERCCRHITFTAYHSVSQNAIYYIHLKRYFIAIRYVLISTFMMTVPKRRDR
jgi:hypothetical protein